MTITLPPGSNPWNLSIEIPSDTDPAARTIRDLMALMERYEKIRRRNKVIPMQTVDIVSLTEHMRRVANTMHNLAKDDVLGEES